MKKISLILIFYIPICLYGQRQTGYNSEVYQSLIPKEKQELLKNVDVIFNTRAALDQRFSSGEYDASKFSVDQFRLEIKGKIHEKVYFRFRDRYTRVSDSEPGNSIDNLSRSTDMAFIGVKITPKLNFTMGKMAADWGGYEFDLNPIFVLEYNDFLANSDCFLTGAGINYKLNDNHELTFQALNSRISSISSIYMNRIPPNVTESKFPVALVTNWRGHFFGNKFETIYSYSHFTEARNRAMDYLALGNKYQDKGLTIMYDFQYSNEGLDRKGIVTGIVKDPGDYIAENAKYLENWLRAEYLITKKLNIGVTLMMSNSYWNEDKGGVAALNSARRLSTSYGIIPTIEYLPFNDLNLRFYVGYIGRSYTYSEYAKDVFGQSDHNSSRISAGFIIPILVF